MILIAESHFSQMNKESISINACMSTQTVSIAYNTTSVGLPSVQLTHLAFHGHNPFLDHKHAFLAIV